MSYEYRSGSQTLEVPNPYAVENKIRFLTGGVFFLAGVSLLFLFRNRMQGGWNVSSLIPLFFSILLLANAVSIIAHGMMQLRFFFGRDRPGTLIPSELPQVNPQGQQVTSYLKEIVRRGALHFPEPQGAINGLLHHLQPDLIFAPRPLRVLAQNQFVTAITSFAILASFLVSWLLLSGQHYDQMIGAIYLLLSLIIIFKPINQNGAANPSVVLPIILVVLAVVAPVVIILRKPSTAMLGDMQFFGATFLVLLLIGVGTSIFFFALRRQLGKLPAASSSMHQLSVSMNCQPNQLYDELSRRLQEKWIEQIPNREYSNLRPDLNLSTEASGTFAVELMQETQPMSAQQTLPRTIKECWSDSKYQLVLVLQAFGAGLLIIATALITYGAWVNTFPHFFESPSALMNIILFSATFYAAGYYCFKGAHKLFGRFDFESKIYWFECNGNYQIASLDYGNVLSDRLKTRKSIVNIETATLRVWVVEIYSTAFDSLSSNKWGRYATAMMGRKQDAQLLAESLAAFAQEQSIVVAPTASQDAKKAMDMARLGLDTNTLTPDATKIAAGLSDNLNGPTSPPFE